MQNESPTRAKRVADTRLGRAVTMNEEIKRVILVSFKVNLMALNAILLARRAGGDAMGFRVLSTELRQFIRDLQETMSRLQSITNDAVRGVTEETRQGRVQGLLQRTMRLVDARCLGARPLEAVLRARADEAASRQGSMVTTMRSLGATVADAAQLGEFGAILARTAKIEAVYGGQFAPSLTQVALEFDGTIKEILQSMDVLRRLHHEGATA